MRINNLKKTIAVFFLVAMLIVVVTAAPTPEGPGTLQIINSSTRIPADSQNLPALAGNVTQLNINAQTQTRTWQGYYGNISGTVLLQDAKGKTMYNWDLSNPSGQIFASISPIDFTDGTIDCYNFTKSGNGYLDLISYESSIGISQTSVDGINETFTYKNDYDPFYVGLTYINKICPTVYLYNSTNESSKNTYQELLLYSDISNKPIYTALIRPGGLLGFNGLMWDFQMIVAENGHNADTQTTTYYFYVALE